MMMLKFEQTSLDWHVGLIALLTLFLTCAPHHVLCQVDDDAQFHPAPRSALSTNSRPRTESSSSFTAILMAIALIRALLEYAQLVLMLLTDPDAVELCYAQHCPVRQMKDELDRLVLAEGEKQREPPAPEPMSKDHISTNMLVTPSQRSESDPDPERDQQRQCDPPRSICACGEEDYLVTMEDDVRKPCIVKPEPNPGDHATKEVKAIPSKAESVIDPAEAFSKPAHEITAVAAPISDVQKEGDRHQWKDELLPAAEATPMDTF